MTWSKSDEFLVLVDEGGGALWTEWDRDPRRTRMRTTLRGRNSGVSVHAECSNASAERLRGRVVTACQRHAHTRGLAPASSSSTRSCHFGPLRAQSSKAEYEGDLSSSLLFQLSDAELENLATEYEYDIQSNKRKTKDEVDYEDEEAEVEVQYEVRFLKSNP